MSEIYNHRQIEDINNVNQELQNADNLQQLHGFQNVNVLMQNRENQLPEDRLFRRINGMKDVKSS